MPKSGVFSQALLELVFQAQDIANIADNAASSPITNLYVSLHTASPGLSGVQTTNEVTYTSYARVAVSRDSGGWAIVGTVINPVVDIIFPTCTGGSMSATFMGIGTDSSGAGNLLYYGPLSPVIAISTSVPPTIKAASTITET